MPVDVELAEAEPPKFLYHGTAERFLESRSPIFLFEGESGETAAHSAVIRKRAGEGILTSIFS